MYQDIWLNGTMIEKGERECEQRYQVIKSYLQDKRVQSVLDIGANMCYFGIRLSEDFGCGVVAFEFHQFEKRKEIVDQQRGDKITFIKKKLKFKNILDLPRFDVILALSVLHHVQEPIGAWIGRLRSRCDHLIIEHAENDSTRPAVRKDYELPDGYDVIGYGDSHLQKDFKRKIIVYAGKNAI